MSMNTFDALGALNDKADDDILENDNEEEVVEYYDEDGNPVDPDDIDDDDIIEEEDDSLDEFSTEKESSGDDLGNDHEEAIEEPEEALEDEDFEDSEEEVSEEGVLEDEVSEEGVLEEEVSEYNSEDSEDDIEYYDEDGNLVDPSELDDVEILEEVDEDDVEVDDLDNDTSEEGIADTSEGDVEDGLEDIPDTSTARLEEGDRGLSNTLNIDATSFQLSKKRINIDSIVVSEPKKKSRSSTYKGLTQAVKELGVLNPIHVMITESYNDYIEAGEEGIFTGSKYLLLDGMRRIYAAYRNKIEELEAVVWKFKDPEYGRDIANVVSLVLNKNQSRKWGEIWHLMQVLESEAAMAPAVLEYLLDLDSGDAAKLKDIALADNYPEVWEELLEGKKDLQKAYAMLSKLRKEEDKSLLEDNSGLSDYEDAEGIVGDSTEGGGQLTEEDARELLEIDGNDDLDFSDMEDEDFLGEEAGELQSTSERKPLDPVLRGKILARDEYSCQICKAGLGVSSSLFAMGLEVHHTTAVYNQLDSSRDDTGNISEDVDIPKLLSICKTDHSLVHLCAGREGKLGITKEEFDALPDHEQDRWRNIAKYAKVLLWAENKSGKSLKKSENFKLPNKPFWEAEKENTEAIQLAQSVEEHGRDY